MDTHLPIAMMATSAQPSEEESRPLYSFSPVELASAVVQTSNLSADLSPRQQDTLATLKMKIDALETKYGKEGLFENEDILRTYATIFDDLFFFGSLISPGQNRIIIKSIDKYYAHDIHPRMGESVHIRSRGICEISIWRLNEDGQLGYRNLSAMTLLHEMVHAFLMLYACGPCNKSWDGGGVTGHGQAWLDIMSILPIELVQHGVLDSSVFEFLDLESDLAAELIDSKREIPDETTLEGWGLNRKRLEKEMMEYQVFLAELGERGVILP
ncbi:hypothetical protein BJ875DRAFT_438128 [Amylocarpus encephaloides]|uniref:SprT-like domain-containing protein n=1 Tax=Amylocarpus encephaloides TaxID=45428 RepID=A0A9P8C8T4_9HELO|nr:hypothetical protein BJ875DRAFT_438128 [Amylocarpus encephaloides]